MSEKFETFYNKNYKLLLVIPAILLAISLIYIGIFYARTGDIINKDVSLTGGTTITIFEAVNVEELENNLSQKFDVIITSVSDNTGKQIRVIVTVPDEPGVIKPVLEAYIGYELTEENSSTAFTESNLSEDFYKQLIIAVILAFFWMAGVVFIIFAKGKSLKFWAVVLNILFGFFLGGFFLRINTLLSTLIFVAFAATLIYMYIKNSIPAFAVMASAFADIVMTLALVNFLGMKISTAGIVAFLMLIGYSVDTDILLTTRILRRKEGTNKALFGAFKTGTTMTLTSIIAVVAALIVVYSLSSVLNQIFTILIIGLGFDLLNTWITNASLIKWYVEKQ